ncbi:MAG: hypothetical protein QOI03_1694 [Solirubrobacteraceae bacterium]|jgi:hypothetical protein|nr:hypothetical protein [Solirubrobacteraceae bacterium]
MRLIQRKGVFAGPLALLALAILTLAPPARADVGETIIQRCTHGQSLAGFRPSDYNRALKELSADAEEYTDCSSLIRAAELAAAGGRQGAAGAAPVPIATTPGEQRAIARATHRKAAPVDIGGRLIHPGVVHVSIASAISKLPTPLLAAIGFLLASLLAVIGRTLRNRVRAYRSA